jgi:hypothetical protein
VRKYIYYILLALVVLLALILRVYKLDKIPPSISWDEASVGYNAYTIANWGKDEWGKILPMSFKAFGEYKLPVHIYITSLFVKIFGLTDFAVRLPAALFGVGNVILIFLLGDLLFKKKSVGIIAAFLLAISPYNLQFSRHNHELNFAIFFLMLGFWLFIKGIEAKKKYIPLAFLCFGIDTLTYNGSKIVVPVLVFLIVVFYIKTLLKNKRYFFLGVLIYVVFLSTFIIDKNLLGMTRFKQIDVSLDEIKATEVYKRTGNMTYGRLSLIGNGYLVHFKDNFLFVSGDKNPRHSIQTIGEFYKIEKIFLIVGALILLFKIIMERDKKYIILLAWILLGPLPASLAALGEAPHAGRAMYMTGSWNLLSALGAGYIIIFLKKWYFRLPVGLIMLYLVIFQFKDYINNYYNVYPEEYAIEWQYGMKDIVSYVKKNPQFYSIYMTDSRSQPYIFFLYYLKTPLPEFLKTVKYNVTASKLSNMVISYDKYHFGVWDEIESIPNMEILYVINPSKYDGLRFKEKFSIMELVKYPNGSDAYFVVN